MRLFDVEFKYFKMNALVGSLTVFERYSLVDQVYFTMQYNTIFV